MANFYSGHGNKKLMIFEDVKDRLDKYWADIERNKDIPSITGIAMALDVTRLTLLNYRKADTSTLNEEELKILNTICGSVIKVENWLEKNLVSSNFSNGIKFSLNNNFGWYEKKEIKAEITTNTKDIDNDELKEFVQGNINKI